VRASRPIIQFACDEAHLRGGEVPLSWKILEQSEGALIQLIYAGPPSIDIAVEGIIEGQRNIVAVKYAGKIQSPVEQMRQGNRSNLVAAVLFGFSSVMLVILLVIDPWTPPRVLTNVWSILLVSFLLLFFGGVFFYFLYQYISNPAPPFGF
jgi:hypothetical protein